MKFYYPIKPTRITVDSDIFKRCNQDSNFILQIKKNGWRVQIHKDGTNVEFFTRHNKRLESIAADANWDLLRGLVIANVKAHSTILDGEFLHRRGKIKSTIHVWDIFEYNNQIVKKRYKERKHLLNSIVESSHNLQVSKDFNSGEFKKIWDNLNNPEENEGVVIKDIRELLYIQYRKPSKGISPKQFKILLDDKRNEID